MSAYCIICRSIQKKFTPEHVFPAAVGGMLIVNNVCQKCNEVLGRQVDQPFLKHPGVLIYRHKYNIVRSRRGKKVTIPNPFKNQTPITDEEGYEYTWGGTLLPDSFIASEDIDFGNKVSQNSRGFCCPKRNVFGSDCSTFQ